MSEQEIRVELSSNPRLLRAMRGLVKGYAASLGFARSKVDEIVLAVDEACTNAMRHAYCGCVTRRLVLTLSRDEAWAEFAIRDTGKPASAECFAHPRKARSKNEKTTPGGLGIPLMHRVFDEVDFARGRTRGNCVTLRLRLPRRKGTKR